MTSLPLSLSPMTPHPHRCCCWCYPLRDTMLQCERPLSVSRSSGTEYDCIPRCHILSCTIVVQHVPFLLRTPDLPPFSTPAFSAPPLVLGLCRNAGTVQWCGYYNDSVHTVTATQTAVAVFTVFNILSDTATSKKHGKRVPHRVWWYTWAALMSGDNGATIRGIVVPHVHCENNVR